MMFLARAVGGLRALFCRTRVDRDLDDELEQYLETAIEQKMRTGMTREDAQHAARVEMGSLEAVKDGVRDVGWESRIETIWRDEGQGKCLTGKGGRNVALTLSYTACC